MMSSNDDGKIETVRQRNLADSFDSLRTFDSNRSSR